MAVSGMLNFCPIIAKGVMIRRHQNELDGSFTPSQVLEEVGFFLGQARTNSAPDGSPLPLGSSKTRACSLVRQAHGLSTGLAQSVDK